MSQPSLIPIQLTGQHLRTDRFEQAANQLLIKGIPL